jgi:hypothetical protein
VSAIVAAATLPVPATPDADWDTLHASALLAIQERQALALEPWTDHNIHDPGITLLEAALWALADLHYRTATRSFETWSAEVYDWRGVPLAAATDRPAVQAELEALLGPNATAPADDLFAASTSRARAVVDLTGRMVAGIGPLSGAAAAAIVRLLREPVVLRAAYDSTPALAEAVASAATESGEIAAAVAALDGSGLWPEEIAGLVRRERRRRFALTLRERRDVILQTIATTPDLGALEALLEIGADDARIALSLEPAPRTDPTMWEQPNGETTLWPPHPLQVLTCEPVTQTDYRRLLLAHPGVKRAWVLPGLAKGILWNGKATTKAFPWRQGAFTFLIAPAKATSNPKVLLSVLGTVLGVDVPAETVKPYYDYRDNPNAMTPRRLLGDELCAAFVKRFPVVVAGTLEVGPSANTDQVLLDAHALLDAFLSDDRVAPFEPPDIPGPAFVAPRDLDGPWPRASGVATYAADPGRETRETGWQPGSAVRVTELVQLLQGIEGVLGVADLRAQRRNSTTWATSSLEIDPYSVPALDGNCLCIRIVDPRECNG